MSPKSTKPECAIGSDHAGFTLKEWLKSNMTDFTWIDYGTNSTQSCDYPDIAEELATAVGTGKSTMGILVCGSGIGMSIAANKVSGARAAVVESELTARLAKAHNHANILCLGSRVLAPEYAREIIKAWFHTEFESGRHQKRVDKLTSLDVKA